MTKADLVEQVTASIARTAGPMISKKDCARVVDAFLEAVKDALKQQHNIEVRGFGTFKIRRRKTRMARNPRTGDPVEVAARPVPVFKPSKELRALVADEGEPAGESAAGHVAGRGTGVHPSEAAPGARSRAASFHVSPSSRLRAVSPIRVAGIASSHACRHDPDRHVRVLLFASYAERLGLADDSSRPAARRDGGATRWITCGRCPAATQIPPRPLCAVNLAHAGPRHAGWPRATSWRSCRRWREAEAVAFLTARSPIDLAALARRVESPAHGGIAVLRRTVRDHHDGRAVIALEYSAYGADGRGGVRPDRGGGRGAVAGAGRAGAPGRTAGDRRHRGGDRRRPARTATRRSPPAAT